MKLGISGIASVVLFRTAMTGTMHPAMASMMGMIVFIPFFKAVLELIFGLPFQQMDDWVRSLPIGPVGGFFIKAAVGICLYLAIMMIVRAYGDGYFRL